ncbi:MAG: hypothetical protein J6T73_02635, partial [Clostridia bacterium]|nr:hypothetical protein [Clostridia bacterium]
LTRFFQYLSGWDVGQLKNTFYKLSYEKSLKIVYIGGSVTSGTGASSDDKGWSALVTDVLQARFQNSTVEGVNMGVGGTGSYLGMARFEDNVIKKNPDLVFIEFAINDRYNGISAEQSKQDTEYMIRALNKSNPYADIVVVLITDREVFGTEYKSYRAIKEVADYYNIPVVDMGAAMYRQLGGSIANWSGYYADGVHPLDAGHKIYADAVADEFNTAFINLNKEPHILSEAYLCENPVTTVDLLTRDTFGPFKWGTLDDDIYGANYWFNNTTYEKSGSPLRTSHSRCFTNILPKYIYPKYDGATLEFSVTGTSIGIIGTIKADQSLTITVDGGSPVTLTGSDSTGITEYPVTNGLSDASHTVKIVAHGSGPYIAITAIFVGK